MRKMNWKNLMTERAGYTYLYIPAVRPFRFSESKIGAGVLDFLLFGIQRVEAR
jgi:hypothetical protein